MKVERTTAKIERNKTNKVERYIHPMFVQGECKMEHTPKGMALNDRIQAALVVYGD